MPNTDYYPDKVEVYGPGVENMGVQKGNPTQFTIDTKKAGSAPVDVQVKLCGDYICFLQFPITTVLKVMDSNCNSVDVNLTQKPDGTIEAVYIPKIGNKHTVQVNFGGVATRNSPYRVFVAEPLDLSKVHCFGPGLENGVKANTSTHFNIDTR